MKKMNKKRSHNAYPDEQVKFIYDNYKGRGNIELAEMFNKKFGTEKTPKQLSSWKKNRGLNSGLTGHFPKGHRPTNAIKKGQRLSPKTEFKKGQKAHNYKPVGSERIDRDGYVLIKVQDDGPWHRRWRHKSRVVWEKKHGPVPRGFILTFLDGNKQNVTLENMAIVSKAENLILNRHDLRVEGSAELTEIGINTSKLINQIGSKQRSKGQR